jgi:hypothetical protein
MRRTLPILALCLAAGTAQAQPRQVDHVETTADLAAVCEPTTTGIARLEAIAYCQGFLTSAGQYHALMYPAGGPVRPLFCVPNPGPTIAESGIGFARWARENPSYAPEPALDGLLRWAQARFPCPPAPTPRRRPR